MGERERGEGEEAPAQSFHLLSPPFLPVFLSFQSSPPHSPLLSTSKEHRPDMAFSLPGECLGGEAGGWVEPAPREVQLPAREVLYSLVLPDPRCPECAGPSWRFDTAVWGREH